MAMRFRAKIEDVLDLLHVYPTMAEALKIVANRAHQGPAETIVLRLVARDEIGKSRKFEDRGQDGRGTLRVSSAVPPERR